MLERAEFTLIRAGITTGIAAVLCIAVGSIWWWRVEHNTPPSTYFDQSAWQRVNQVLAQVQPVETTFNTQTTPSTCNPADKDHALVLSQVKRFNEQLEEAQRQQFLQRTYVLNAEHLVRAPDLAPLRCREIVSALTWLTQKSSESQSVLQTLNWKERLPGATQSRMPANLWVSVARPSWASRSPWAGLPGCVLWTNASGEKVAASGSSTRDKFCQTQAQTQMPLPELEGQSQLLSRLAPWRMPQHPLYERLVSDRNLIQLRGNEQPMGLNVQLTLDPLWQRLGQQLADCYSGKLDTPECDRQALDQTYFERARVRLAGISVVDVSSGRILVAASASSPCHAFDQTRTNKRQVGCPNIAEGTVHRPKIPQVITNHALFTQAPPGSLVKPLMMAGILSQPGSSMSIEGLDAALQRSDSQRFLDAFLCRQRLGSGSFQTACQRPQKTLDAAHKLGWNLGCDAKDERSLMQCGKLDLLHGIPMSAMPESMDAKYLQAGFYQPIQWPTLLGQILVKPTSHLDGSSWIVDMSLPQELPDTDAIAQCARSGKTGYSRCKGRRLGIISEAYGQGNARTTPIGVASMLSAIANSAQTHPHRYPHLLEGLWLSDGRPDPAYARPMRQGLPVGQDGISASHSQRIIAAMEKTHTLGGTAYSACLKVMGADACRGSLGIAGKTGTPGDVDERSLEQLNKDQLALQKCRLGTSPQKCDEQFPAPRPRYRWYAALFKSDVNGPYDKAIAVLVHSNWRRSDGRFADEQSAAAELAMRFIKSARTQSSGVAAPTSTERKP